VPEANVSVVHNGIRLQPFEQPANASLRGMLTGGTERPIVFTPARLHPQKGHVFLLEAAVHVSDALFVLAGDGPDRGALEAQAKKLGIEDRVCFLGQRQDIPQLLAACDLFVLPSLFEGLPLSVLEAMAAGKPVIATDIGGTNEAVVHRETGLLVPPGNPVELAAAIRDLLTNRSLAACLAEAGRRRVQQKFSSEAMVQGVTRVYDELV
jgi:glycosyltransferase involved in cell wall biosynthesis